VATLLYFRDYLARQPKFANNEPAETYDQNRVVIKLSQFTEDAILSLVSRHNLQPVKYIAKNERAQLHRGKDGNVHVNLFYRDEHFKIHFKEEDNTIITKCSCAETISDPVCIHKAGALLQLLYEDGKDAFLMLKNFDADKETLLQQYGYSLEDEDVDELFRFKLVNGGLIIQPTDSSIIKLDAPDIDSVFNFSAFSTKLQKRTPKIGSEEKKENFGLGYFCKKFDSDALMPLEIVPFQGKLNKEGTRFASHLSELKENFTFSSLALMDDADRKVLRLLDETDEQDLKNYLADLGFRTTGYKWGNLYKNDFPSEAKSVIDQYLIDLFSPVFRLLKQKKFYISTDNQLRVTSLSGFDIQEKQLIPHFELREEEDDLVLEITLWTGDKQIPTLSIDTIYPFGVFTKNNSFFPLNSLKEYQGMLLAHTRPLMRVRKSGKDSFIQRVIMPLLQAYPIDSKIELNIQDIDGEEPEAKLFLDEANGYLALTPIFEYDHQQITHDQLQDLVYAEEDGTYYRVKRDYDYEEEMVSILATSHEQFVQEGPTFFLGANQVLENNWFFEVFDYLREKGFEIFGFSDLKTFKYSPFKPETKFQVSSGMDWFDCEITVSFGDQFVSLKDIRKAVLNDEHYVKLADGTLGILPAEWIAKYGMLLKLGNIDKDSIQISKLHFSIVDELYAEIDNDDVLREIEDKKRKLRDFDKIKAIKPSENVKANLRDYQESGLNWMHFLDEFRWGGCLADDMGLGKTLQTLTFIQSLTDKNPKTCCLVVVPTSLIFNWSNEMDKFTPNLKYLVHHGTQRTPHIETFMDYNVIMTTYGVIVRDVDRIKELNFDYVILDESQAIKNVTSKRYKAVSLLNSHNKLVLTGTPVENNTFELYAQMNFLNPGILGTQEFFKKEYANPIDKKGETDKVRELKKIVYPFILRRTKEQVAQDLPDKSENILFCEMGTKQRKVYDAFKNHYRDKLLDIIQDQGIEKSGIYILEGLLKLRQICDSPALLKGKEKHTDESVKMNELSNHVSELVGKHKILIFSQFVGMLSLIRKQLERKGVNYSYLDGQTRNRQEVVEDFQNNEEKRVFLISLKAGGVGLNLTAADYVYLVDPWWNPAVEQQAIDRTHRIGQTQKVFAYKMICKDTVEEKILKLQEKKKALVNDIISAEKSLLKSLTKDDVVDLFS
jgi:non-specific serine/threonine protein kinase